MRHTHQPIRRILLAVVACASLSSLVRAQARTEVVINDTGAQAENLTSSQDGAVYFGSTATGTIYRAAPGASQAEPWIQASTAGLSNVLGVLADDKTNTLWVCQNNTGGRGGAPVVGQTALRSFDLKSGAAKGTYPFPTNGGVCNDMAIATDGTVYATESFGNRIHRLRPGATALDVWATDPQLAAIDGIALLADGAVYVNTFFERPALPHSGECGRQRRRHRADRDVDAAESARRVAHRRSADVDPGRGSGTRGGADDQRQSRGRARVAGRTDGPHRCDSRWQYGVRSRRAFQGRARAVSPAVKR